METLLKINQLKDSVWDKIDNHNKNNIEVKTILEINHYRNVLNQYFNLIEPSNSINENKISETVLGSKETSTPLTRLKAEINDCLSTYLLLANGIKDPFKLFIMGQGNYGKSTLINSLLATGEKAATEGILPVTWKIDVFYHNTDNLVKIVFKDNKELYLSPLEAEDLIKAEEEKVKHQKREIKKKLKAFIQEYKPSKNEIADYEKKLEREEMVYSDVIEVHWPLNNSRILRKFSIVDTPGLNQYNTSGELMNSAQDYYHKSDGVIWLLDAVAISSGGSARMLEELNDSISKLGNKRSAADSMIAVLNRIDLVAESEEDKNKVIESAREIYGDIFKTIIPYSAKQAFESLENNDKELEMKSGKLELLYEIHQKFFDNSKKLQCEKKIEDCNSYNQIIKEKTKKFNEECTNNMTMAIKNADSVRGSFNYLIDGFALRFDLELRSIYREFQTSLIDNLEALSKAPRGYKPGYVDELFKTHSIRRAFSEQIDDCKENLNLESKMILKYKVTTQYESLREFMQIKDINVEFNPTIIITEKDAKMPSVVKSATASAIGAGIALGPVGALVAGGLSAYRSHAAREEEINKFDKLMRELLNNLREQYRVALAELILATEKAVSEKILMSFCSMYSVELNKYTNNNVEKRVRELVGNGEEMIRNLSEKVSIDPGLLDFIAYG